MKTKRIFTVLIVLCLFVMTVTVSADMGPKPSVVVRFSHMDDTPCIATLLSASPSTGPASVWDGVSEVSAWYYEDIGYENWLALAAYTDTDGYYFLKEAWSVNETKALAWTYYPPNPFKLLLYYPETGEFLVSGIYERYAFDSYFAVDLAAEGDLLTLSESYDYTNEAISLAARIVATIVIEMSVALLFGFRTKHTFLFLLYVNIATQIILNVILNVTRYRDGYLAYLFTYFLCELIVVILEAVAYCIYLGKVEKSPYTGIPRSRVFYILYAILANAVSFVVGWALARYLPGMY